MTISADAPEGSASLTPAPAPGPRQLTRIDEETVRVTLHNMGMLARLVREHMREGVHYRRFGAETRPALMDAGAALIRSVCRVVPRHRILSCDREPDTGHVRYVVEAVLVRPIVTEAGEWVELPVASGVASCSSREVKYAYRWVRARDMPPDLDRSSLPRRERGRELLYRVPNPDVADLDNTILKMACKRAEVDATLQLPGVSEIFADDFPLDVPAIQQVDRVTGEIVEEEASSPPAPESEPGATASTVAAQESGDARERALSLAREIAPGTQPYITIARLLGLSRPETGMAAIQREWLSKGHSWDEAASRLQELRNRERLL